MTKIIFPDAIFYFVELILLIIGTRSDLKERKIPKYIGICSVLLGLIALIYNKHYWLAAFYVLAVYAPSMLALRIALICFGFIVYSQEGMASLPLMISLGVTLFFFNRGLIGGGDTQMAFGMLGIEHQSWNISIIICVITIVTNIMLCIRKFGIKKSFSRIKTVGKSITSRKKIEEDKDRLRSPFLVTLTAAWITYGVLFLFL